MRIEVIAGGASVTWNIALPDMWAEKPPNCGKAIWLIHDAGEASDVWFSNAPLELLANKYGAAFIVPSMGMHASCEDAEPACTWETFFTQGLWNYVHALIPVLSDRREDHLVFGRGAGAEGALRFYKRPNAHYGAAGTYRPNPDLDPMDDWRECVRELEADVAELCAQ